MARLIEEWQEALKFTVILLIVTITAIVAATLLHDRVGALVAAGFAGIAATITALSVPLWFESRYDDVVLVDVDCDHESLNTTRDERGDTYYFCDECGEQVDPPEMGAH